jgi:hypothetical protein
MVEPEPEIARLKRELVALGQDRDYWRAQHDLVMQDWRSDLAAWTAAHAGLVASHEACRTALVDLLRFFDPATGAVATRQGREFLGDAFARAAKVCAAEPAAATSVSRDDDLSPS